MVKILLALSSLCFAAMANPIVLKESSPSGESIIAISSADPDDVKKYINFAFPSEASTQENSGSRDSLQDGVGRSFSFVTPGGAAAGTGRSFVSTSAFNPFFLPLIFNPINFEGLGLNHFGSVNDLFKGINGIYEPGFGGDGEVKTVSAVNDNGHIYGNVKTITFDNRAKSSN